MPASDHSGSAKRRIRWVTFLCVSSTGFSSGASGARRAESSSRCWGHCTTVFHSTAFEVARNLTLFFVVLLWLGLAFWVHRDARRRIDDPWLVGTATLLGARPARRSARLPPLPAARDARRRAGARAGAPRARATPPPPAAAVPGLPERASSRPSSSARSARPSSRAGAASAPGRSSRSGRPARTAPTPVGAPVGRGSRRGPDRRGRPTAERTAARGTTAAQRGRVAEARRGCEKPTRGFEPRTPSLRVKCSTS